jgi:hypothetical protein
LAISGSIRTIGVTGSSGTGGKFGGELPGRRIVTGFRQPANASSISSHPVRMLKPSVVKAGKV